MTQADFQRDVERLETLRDYLTETADSMDEAVFEAFDRAIENARVLASLTDERREYLTEHHATLAGLGFDNAHAHLVAAQIFGGK